MSNHYGIPPSPQPWRWALASLNLLCLLALLAVR